MSKIASQPAQRCFCSATFSRQLHQNTNIIIIMDQTGITIVSLHFQHVSQGCLEGPACQKVHLPTTECAYSLCAAIDVCSDARRYISMDKQSNPKMCIQCTCNFGKTERDSIWDRSLSLVTSVGTYAEWHYIEHFSVNKCQNFEGTGHTLWRFMVPSNTFKGFLSVTCEQG